jgi:hypothetical protein
MLTTWHAELTLLFNLHFAPTSATHRSRDGYFGVAERLPEGFDLATSEREAVCILAAPVTGCAGRKATCLSFCLLQPTLVLLAGGGLSIFRKVERHREALCSPFSDGSRPIYTHLLAGSRSSCSLLEFSRSQVQIEVNFDCINLSLRKARTCIEQCSE